MDKFSLQIFKKCNLIYFKSFDDLKAAKKFYKSIYEKYPLEKFSVFYKKYRIY